jgi:TP901 family phage tail tape measure protein
MPLRIPAEVTGLEASVQAAAKKAGRNLKLNLGTNSKSIEGLSQPLGRITGKADQFTKSMEAANARVLAFGASVGVLNAVTQGFKDLVTTTIQVEKSMTAINAILGKTTGELNRFKGAIFDVARNTEQSFATVAEAALELSRQGLEAEEVTARLNDALILARLSGQGAAEAVAGLTSAINGFKKSGITSTQVVNKFSEAAKNAAVSERDLAEAFKRAGAVAGQAGVSFDELAGIVSAVQQKTSRGGAVIGNSFKTIFTRLQSLDKLQTMQNLGVQVTDSSGAILNATQLIKNLASTIKELPEAKQLQIAEDLVGKFQVAPFVSILEDFNDQQSIAIKLTQISQNASTAAYERNTILNNTLSAAINRATVNLKELFDTLGSIGVTDQLKTIVGFFSGLAENINKVLEGDSIGSKFAKGIVKGIGNVLSGPGLAIFGAILLKLTADLAKFGVGSLQTFFGLNKAAKEQATLQGQIASTLLNNKGVQQSIMAIENSTLSIEQKRVAQTKFFTTALNEQLAVMTRMQSIASRVAPGVMVGTRGRGRGRGAAEGFVPNYNATMGYAPNFAAESSDIAKGVGGAPRSARPVAIPNFNFGGGQRGSMVANTSEFIVPNFAGTGGSAIFNQDMISSMGMPSGAKSIGAAGGFIPNFASRRQRAARLQQFNQGGKNFGLITGKRGGDKLGRIIYVSDADDKKGGETFTINPKPNTFGAVSVPTFQLPTKGSSRRAGSLDINKVAGKISQFSTNRAVENAKLLSGRNDMPRPLQKKFIESQLNVGSVKGMAGTVFEASLTALLSDQKFKDVQSMTATSLIDLPKSPLLYSAFGIPTGMAQQGVEVKGTGSTSLIADAARKFYQVEAKNRRAFTFKKGTMQSQTIGRLGSAALARAGNKRGATKNTLFGDLTPNQRRTIEAAGGRVGSAGAGLAFAGGYIPNFAMGALDQAVARESAAGLPINQIRINQDSSLRNAGNPMGLAVTNTRDEPTGAIPNFARRTVGEGGGTDLLTKVFLLQSAFALLTPTVDEVTEQNKLMVGAMKALNIAVTAMFVGQAFGAKNIGAALNPFSGGMGANMRARGLAQQQAARGLKGATGQAATLRRNLRFQGALRGVGGGLMRLTGPLAIVTAGFIAFKEINDLVLGTSKNLAASNDMAAEASKRAASELAKLQVPDEFKQERAAKAKEDAAFIVQNIKDRRGLAGFAGGAVQGSDDKKFLNDLATAIESATVRGGDSAAIDRITTPLIVAAGERKLTQDEILDAIDSLGMLQGVGKGGQSKAANRVIAEMFSNFQREGVKVGEGKDTILGRDLLRNIRAIEEVDQRLKRGERTQGQIERGERAGETDEEKKLRISTRDIIRRSLRDANLQTGLAEGVMKGIGLERAGEVQADDRIANQVFKQRIKFLTEIEALDTRRVDNAKFLLRELQATDQIDKSLISNAKLKVIDAEADQKIRNKTLQTSAEIVALGKDLTVTTTQEKDLRDAITKANDDGLISDTERAKILAISKKILTDQGRETSLQLQKLEDGLELSTQSSDAERERLKTIENQNEALRVQRVLLDTDDLKEKRRVGNLDATTNIIGQAAVIREKLFQQQTTNRAKGGSILDEEAAQRSISLSRIRQNRAQRGLDLRGFEAGQSGQFINTLNEFRDQFTSTFTQTPTEMFQNARGAGLVGQGQRVIDQLELSKTGSSHPMLNALENADRNKLIENLKLMRDGVINAQENFKQAADASVELEKEAERLSGVFVGTSLQNLLINRRVSNARGINQQLLDAESNTSNIERLRGRRRVGLESRISSRFQESLLGGEPFGIDEERDMRRQFEFTDKLVQASNVFAQNIGAAMVDAIARGADLGEVLQSAAANFFNTLSSAFMQSAVDDIVGGFGGGISAAASGLTGLAFANSGGMIRGGSGTRDDVPTLLTGGEFVMRKSAVQRYGPEFMAALNSGRVGGMQTGGMFTPGTFGQGAITGKSDLLNFSTQSFTGGSNDILGGSGGLGFSSLEPQSGRLTMFGRRNSPMFQREQESKRAAFGLYARQVQLEEQEKERAKQQRKGLLGSIVAAVAGIALKGITNNLFGSKAGVAQTVFEKTPGRAIPVGGASGVLSGRGSLGARSGILPQDIIDLGGSGPSTDLGGGMMGILPPLPQYATGGYVSPRAGIDNVPSMLSGGEFVMNAAATQRIGAGNLAAANAGGGGGEGKEAVVARLDELIAVTQNSGETVINITVNSDGSQTEEGSGGEEEQNLARRIRDVVKQTIDDEQRLGGSLRRV